MTRNASRISSGMLRSPTWSAIVALTAIMLMLWADDVVQLAGDAQSLLLDRQHGGLLGSGGRVRPGAPSPLDRLAQKAPTTQTTRAVPITSCEVTPNTAATTTTPARTVESTAAPSSYLQAD